MTLSELTEQQILDMEQATDLDELVAVEIMGWKKDVDYVHWSSAYTVRRLNENGEPDGDFSPCYRIQDAYEAENTASRDVLPYQRAFNDTIDNSADTYGEWQWQAIHPTPLQRCKALLIWKKRTENEK